MQLSILQTCVPHYRIPFFDELDSQLGGSILQVHAGTRFYGGNLKTAATSQPWYAPCRNRFLCGDRALWQTDLRAIRKASHLIVEGNPRALRTWGILIGARRRGTSTAVWGHALGRNAERMAPHRKALYNLADTIICYCQSEQPALKRLFPKKTILVAGNSVLRQSECRPLDRTSIFPTSVLFLGRLIGAKKPLLLLRALKQLQDVGVEIGAEIIGDGPERAQLETFVSESRLKGITFHGEITNNTTIRKISESCFAMISPGYIGLSILHALGMGLPVVFSEAEPNAPEVEAARPGWNSITFQSDDPDSLADAIHSIQRDFDQWQSKAAAFSSMIADHYTLERMASQFKTFAHNERSESA